MRSKRLISFEIIYQKVTLLSMKQSTLIVLLTLLVLMSDASSERPSYSAGKTIKRFNVFLSKHKKLLTKNNDLDVMILDKEIDPHYFLPIHPYPREAKLRL